VSKELFTDHKTGKLKIAKEGRGAYTLFIADTVKNPDEIRLLSGDFQDEALYFLSRYMVHRTLIHILAVFKKTGKLWTGWTGYQSKSAIYFEEKRQGALLYRKE